METTKIQGQESWKVSSPSVEAFVSRTGGMVGPVRFMVDGRSIEPFSVAPWSEEDLSNEPPLIRALRGDFFCMPFGHGPDPYLGETHPIHGEAANGEWQFDSLHGSTLDLVFECKIRPCKVYKTVRCGDGVIYQKNTVLGLSGPMSYGTHAMVQFRSPGLIGTNKVDKCQVFPGKFENPGAGGYSSLREGEEFDDLSRAPLATGGTTDLTSYPARAGFEDLVQYSVSNTDPLGWATVTFPQEGYVYFQIKNLSVLASTVLWFSHGGRHYAPWNGRHRNVLGIEEVTSYFHLGLRGSVMPNPLASRGVATFRDFHPGEPLDVRTIQGVCAIPDGFDKVVHVVATGAGLVLVSESGARVEVPVDVMFLGLR